MTRWPWEETTMDMFAHSYNVRLWIDPEKSVAEYDWRVHVERIVCSYTQLKDIAHGIAEFGAPLGLTAVQVRKDGTGHMIYTVPFETER